MYLPSYLVCMFVWKGKINKNKKEDCLPAKDYASRDYCWTEELASNFVCHWAFFAWRWTWKDKSLLPQACQEGVSSIVCCNKIEGWWSNNFTVDLILHFLGVIKPFALRSKKKKTICSFSKLWLKPNGGFITIFSILGLIAIFILGSDDNVQLKVGCMKRHWIIPLW